MEIFHSTICAPIKSVEDGNAFGIAGEKLSKLGYIILNGLFGNNYFSLDDITISIFVCVDPKSGPNNVLLFG